MQVLDDPVYGWLGPRYLDIDNAGRLVVADQDAHRILLIEKDGRLVGILGDGLPGSGPNKFDDPEGVDIWGPAYYFQIPTTIGSYDICSLPTNFANTVGRIILVPRYISFCLPMNG